jgi:transaldolase
LKVFSNHGLAENSLKDSLDKATQVLAQLKEKKIDLDGITKKLEDEGTQKFNKVSDKILEAIVKKKLMHFYD